MMCEYNVAMCEYNVCECVNTWNTTCTICVPPPRCTKFVAPQYQIPQRVLKIYKKNVTLEKTHLIPLTNLNKKVFNLIPSLVTRAQDQWRDVQDSLPDLSSDKAGNNNSFTVEWPLPKIQGAAEVTKDEMRLYTQNLSCEGVWTDKRTGDLRTPERRKFSSRRLRTLKSSMTSAPNCTRVSPLPKLNSLLCSISAGHR